MRMIVKIVMVYMNKIKSGQSFSRETLAESYFEVKRSHVTTESKEGSEIMIDIIWEELNKIPRQKLFEASASAGDLHNLLMDYMKD